MVAPDTRLFTDKEIAKTSLFGLKEMLRSGHLLPADSEVITKEVARRDEIMKERGF